MKQSFISIDLLNIMTEFKKIVILNKTMQISSNLREVPGTETAKTLSSDNISAIASSVFLISRPKITISTRPSNLVALPIQLQLEVALNFEMIIESNCIIRFL